MESSDGGADTPGASDKAAQDNKPKRVRTGCLTCRERHLKCDELKPDCQNCLKSSRKCKKGVRLNFIDQRTEQPPTVVPLPGPSHDFDFYDESREIADGYQGGRARYPPKNESGNRNHAAAPDNNYAPFMGMQNRMPPPASSPQQPLASMQNVPSQQYPEEPQNLVYAHQHQHQYQHHHPPQPQPGPSHHHHLSHDSTFSGVNMSQSGSYGDHEQSASPKEAPRDYLDTQEEVLFMQVFVEEVGLWMDSMDPTKHFSRLLPFHGLSEPMLLNAFLACGARHLSLVNTKYTEDKALHYYNTATQHLLEALQNPHRNTVTCATTAVILNVYEIMCEKALQRMNHIAGARALIKECGWNARSTGIGAACFWLNVGMELLSCLHFNWQVAWDPDEWGVDMDFSRETESNREEIWTHRIVYIVAKIANFRATIPRSQDASAQVEQARLQDRYAQWQRLKDLADSWNENIPRTMHPMAYLFPGHTLSGSAFPEVWLIKRTSIVARLFYHTAMCLLAQINPLQSPNEPEMGELQRRHSQLICGISAHVKDRGVASVALRSLAIAAECLTTRREQEEVLQIFDKIRQETGWRVGFLNNELKEKWGWNEQPAQDQNAMHVMPNVNMAYQQQNLQPQVALAPAPPTSLPPAPPVQMRRPAQGIMNPLLIHADFKQASHPYQSHYVAPNPLFQAQYQAQLQQGNYFPQLHHPTP